MRDCLGGRGSLRPRRQFAEEGRLVGRQRADQGGRVTKVAEELAPDGLRPDPDGS